MGAPQQMLLSGGMATLSTSLTAGTQGANGETGFDSGIALGSLSNTSFNGGTITQWADAYVASAYVGTSFKLTVAADPGKGSIQTIKANGVTWTIGGSTTYVYSGGVATWSELFGSGFGFASPNVYNPVTINL